MHIDRLEHLIQTLEDVHKKNLENKCKAKDFFQELYLYDAAKENRTVYYWPCGEDYRQIRVLALLFAAEIFETGGL